MSLKLLPLTSLWLSLNHLERKNFVKASEKEAHVLSAGQKKLLKQLVQLSHSGIPESRKKALIHKIHDYAIRNERSKLYQTLIGYLVDQKIKKDVHVSFVKQLEILNERGQENLYQRKISAYLKWKKELTFPCIRDYGTMYEVEKLDIIHSKKTKRSNQKNLALALSYLDVQYHAERLKFECERINRNNILGEDVPTTMSKEMWVYIKKEYKHYPVLLGYFSVYKILTSKRAEREFADLSEWLLGIPNLSANEDVQSIFQYLLNFCLTLYNKNKKHGKKYLFLIEEMEKNKVLLEDGKISAAILKNVITLNLRFGKVGKARDFLEKHKNIIEHAEPDEITLYHKAHIAFYEKEFRQCIYEMLNQGISTKDPFYNIGKRILVIQSYYELGNKHKLLDTEVSAFKNHLDNLRKYMYNNKKTNKQYYTPVLQFIKYAQRLLVVRKNRTKARKYHAEVLSSQNIASRDWLIAQYDKLK